MPNLTISDPSDGQEVLADAVNNRRSQIESVVNALDDVNLAANYPTQVETALASLDETNGSLGYLRLGSSPYQVSSMFCREHFTTGNPPVAEGDIYMIPWKPLIYQNQAISQAYVGVSGGSTTAEMSDQECNYGLIPFAKTWQTAGFELIYMAGGLLSFSASDVTNSTSQQVAMRHYDVDDGDTSAGSNIGAANLYTIATGGSSGTTSIFTSGARYASLPTLTDEHLRCRLLRVDSFDASPSNINLTFTYERIAVFYTWMKDH